MNIIGISALYHDSACCLIQDGRIISAAQEERFTRVKHDRSMPYHAFKYCLESAGTSITDIDCIAYYENPVDKLARQLWSGFDIEKKELRDMMDPRRPLREIREVLGYTGPVEFVSHHLSHAASSFFFSGVGEAAILTVDGVGEWATTTYGYGNSQGIELFEQVDFPDSIGLLYSMVTSYLGFKVNNGEYKVMGLAPYGKPVFADKIRKLIHIGKNGQYFLDMRYFDYISGERMYSEEFIALMGQPPRIPESELSQFHKDIARSLQLILEEFMLNKTIYLYKRTGSKNLCMAGGVALNCVANGRILKEGPFEKIFVQPAANDSGGAIGAAAVVYAKLSGRNPEVRELEHVYLGPRYSCHEIRNLLDATSIEYRDFGQNTDELIKITAGVLAKGKVVGWFQGKMEFGPRALGARSIIADPRVDGMRDRINSMVKKREGFRPFAPSVLEDKMKEHFDLDTPSPYMLMTCGVVSPFSLPAITHVDNSARIQTVNEYTNPLYAQLIREFEKITECPIILNTSFNVRGEPIVMSPFDALSCFINTKIDCLVLGDFLIERSKNSFTLIKAILAKADKADASLDGRLYAFI